MLVLGSVFLVVTGGEALYADMGHFGRRPIQVMWYSVVLPGLVLNYFGQGALLLDRPEAVENPFYELVPEAGVIPLTILATAATVIASQALISGAFSLTMQAINLGYLPRLRIHHTSPSQFGQIYIPTVNWGLAVACIALVVSFGSSTNLAAAYGVAVTMTMFITTVLFYVVCRRAVGLERGAGRPVCGLFLVVDVAFLAGNIVKIPDGGWFPLVIGAVIFTVMTTWRTGRSLVAARLREAELSLDAFVDSLMRKPPARVPGTAVYMSSRPYATPAALLANVRFNEVVHEEVVVLGVNTERTPVVPVRPQGRGRRPRLRVLRRWCCVSASWSEPMSPRHCRHWCRRRSPSIHSTPCTSSGGNGSRPPSRPGMAIWRERLFAILLRNATDVGNFYHLPTDRTVEIGQRVDI